MHNLLPLALLLVWVGIIILLKQPIKRQHFVSDYAAVRTQAQKQYIVAMVIAGVIYGVWAAWLGRFQLSEPLIILLGCMVVITQYIGIVFPRRGRFEIVHDVVLFLSAMSVAGINIVLAQHIDHTIIQGMLLLSALSVLPAYAVTGYLLFVRKNTSTIIIELLVLVAIHGSMLLANAELAARSMN